MNELIAYNPYRLLGVYSNSPTREKMANIAKLKAFLKVRKIVSFPLDLPGILPAISRTEEMVAAAETKLALPADQLKYAQFWFIKDTPLDDVAFNHLFGGDMSKAIEIWNKKDNASSLQNRIVCALIKNDYSTACSYAQKLYEQFAVSFVKAVAGETMTANESAFGFLDGLVKEIGVNQLLPHIRKQEWRQHLSSAAISPIIDKLQSEVESSKANREKGPDQSYKAGVSLMNCSKKLLGQLKELISSNEMQYQMIADKVANEILQCGIDYFNDTESDDAPSKVMTLFNYASSIAVGQMVKDRCQENITTIKELEESYAIRHEMRRIGNLLKSFRGNATTNTLYKVSSSVFDDISALLANTRNDLQSIKQKMGTTNSMYLDVSSAIVSAAINALVEKINFSQNMAYTSSGKESLKSDVRRAVSIMSELGQMDMTSACRSYYNGNNNTLNRINSQLNPSGCYIATMAYGDYDHPQVMVLRKFRDEYLDKRDWGKRFIRYYYAHSPIWVEHLKNHKMVNLLIRRCLDSFVYFLKK